MATKFPAPKHEFIPARFKGGRQTPKAIVMHGTVSSDNKGTARRIAQWWNGPTSPKSSAHYTVDPVEIIQSVGDHTVAFHCGFNQDSIGVELCDEQQGPASRWRDDDSRAILRNASRLVAQLCLAFNIEPRRPSIADLKAKGPHGIYGHDDSRQAFGNTTHTDPRDFDWTWFILMVRHEIEAIKSAANEIPEVPSAGGVKDPRSAKRAWRGFLHLKARFYMNYRLAVLKASKRKTKRALDVDTQVSAEGTPWALHWKTVKMNRLHDPRGIIKGHILIKELSDKEIGRLRGPRGQIPRKLSLILALANRLGVRIEVELKARLSEKEIRKILTSRAGRSMNSRGLLQFKTLAQLGGSVERLGAVHSVGGVTILSFTGYEGRGIHKAQASIVVDYVRGKPKWR